MITILILIAFFPLGYLYCRAAAWLVMRAERDAYPQEAAEAPCQMCDRPAIGPDHDCADPVDQHASLAKALLTPDCPTIVAGSDIDASQWAGIVQQLPDLAEIDAARLEAFYLIPDMHSKES